MQGIWSTNRSGISGSVSLNGQTVQLKSDSLLNGLSSLTLSSGSGISTIASVATNSTFSGNVRIGTTIPSFPRVFHITATSSGAVLPNLTTVQRNAITNTSISELLYNTTTSQFEYWNGTSWVTFGGGGSSLGVNLGITGARIYSSNSGSNLQFRRITGGTGVTVTENTNDITLTSEDISKPPSLITSDEVPVTLSTISIPNGSTGYVEVGVIGSSTTDAVLAIIGKKYLKFQKTNAGILSTLGLPNSIVDTGLSGLTTADFDLAINANNIDIVVTGEIATNIKWVAKIDKFISILP
jgi:hypothetical protein